MTDIITGTISGLISSIIMLFIDKQTIIGLFKDSKNIEKIQKSGVQPAPYSYFQSSYSYSSKIEITKKSSYTSPTSNDDALAYVFLLLFPIIAFIVLYVSFIGSIITILYWIIGTSIFLTLFTIIRYMRTKKNFSNYSMGFTFFSFIISAVLPVFSLVYFLAEFKSVSKNGVTILDISKEVNENTEWNFTSFSVTLNTFVDKFNFLRDNYIEFTPIFTITLVSMLFAILPVPIAARNIRSINSLISASLKLNPSQKTIDNAALATPRIFWIDTLITSISIATSYLLISGSAEKFFNIIINWATN